jgi:hypothetical protein
MPSFSRDIWMAIAHEKNNCRDAREPSPPPLRIVFFEESAASFFEMAVDHFLGFDLITDRECTHLSVFYADDTELRADLLESARRLGGDEVPESKQ